MDWCDYLNSCLYRKLMNMCSFGDNCWFDGYMIENCFGVIW